jgi:hypothetical protein
MVSYNARQTARGFRGFGIFLLFLDATFVIFHAFLLFRAISRSYTDLTLDLNLAALHFVGNLIAVTDLLGGITSFIHKSKQCTVKQVESTNCFLISMFTMYADANAIARASLALKDKILGFDELYRSLTILLFVSSFMSTMWSIAVFMWSKALEERDCEKEEDTPHPLLDGNGTVEDGVSRVTSAARRLIAANAPKLGADTNAATAQLEL